MLLSATLSREVDRFDILLLSTLKEKWYMPHEAHLSTKEGEKTAQAWVSHPYGNAQWSRGTEASPSERSAAIDGRTQP